MNTPDKSAQILFLLTLGLCGYVGYGPKLEKKATEPPPQPVVQEETEPEPVHDWRDLLREHCQTLLDTADAANQDYALHNVSELEDELEYRIEEIRRNIPRLLDQLASLKGATNLAWLMTKDKVSGSTEFPELLEKRFRPALQEPILDLLSDIEGGLLLLEDQLNTESTNLATEVLTYVETQEIPVDNSAEKLLLEFRKDHEQFQLQTAEISTLTTAGLFGASLTALFLKPSLTLARNVLGHISGRMATATGIGTAASVADGPFPFGEAVLVGLEVGGAIWSGYDLHKAQVVLKRDLRRQLNASLDQVQSRIRATLYQRIEESLEKHNQQNHQIIAALFEPAPVVTQTTQSR